MISFIVSAPSTFFNCSATVGPTVHVRLKQTQIVRRNKRYVVTTWRLISFYFVCSFNFFNVSATVGPTVHVRLSRLRSYVETKDML
jgi:hypothetical protein